MADKDEPKKDDELSTDKPMRAADRIWGDELKPGAIEIKEVEIEEDD